MMVEPHIGTVSGPGTLINPRNRSRGGCRSISPVGCPLLPKMR